MRVLVVGIVLHRLLHRAQVEEELALRLGRGDLDHAPVLEDVLVDLGLDPVHGVADQANALVRVEALDGLHQADVAFLDQVAVGQAVAEVLARDRDDQAQVRDDQAAGGRQVAVVAQATGELGLLFLGQKRDAVDGADVGVEVAEGRDQGPGVPDGEGARRRVLHGEIRHSLTPFSSANISTRGLRVLRLDQWRRCGPAMAGQGSRPGQLKPVSIRSRRSSTVASSSFTATGLVR